MGEGEVTVAQRRAKLYVANIQASRASHRHHYAALDGIKGSKGHTYSPGRQAQIRDNMELSKQAPVSRVARTKDTSILYARLF